MKKALFTVISVIWILLIVGCSSFSSIPEEANETSRIPSSSFDTDSAQDIKKSEVATTADSKQVVPTNSSGQKKKNYKTFDSFGYVVEGEDLNALAEVLYASDEFYGSYRLLDTIGNDTKALDKSLHLNEYRKQWTKIKCDLNVYFDYLENPDRYYFFFERQIPGTYSSIPLGSSGPAGGYVFYDKGSYSDGWRYLEAAPAPLRVVNGIPTVDSTSIGYSNGQKGFIFGDVHGVQSTRFVTDPVTGSNTNYNCLIGKGSENTRLLIEAMGDEAPRKNPEGTTPFYAAKVCSDLQYNGYDDWFLPSHDELKALLMLLIEKKGPLYDSINGERSFITSSEHPNGYVYYEFIRNGSYVSGADSFHYATSNGFLVLPIRAF